MRYGFARFLTLLAAVFFSISAYSEALLQLGELSYSRAPAPYLRTTVRMQPSFFRAVGGVAFDAVATGRDGLMVTALRYDANKPDGRRLIVTVNRPGQQKVSVEASIYDWQLIPIARFAASDVGSAVTLFGDLEDRGFQRDLLAEGGRAINYHPVLDNTLVGLRLLQADIMLFDPNAIDLPRRVGGGYVLGNGESNPDLDKNRIRFLAIQNMLEREDGDGNSYTSYVVGDLNTAVEFNIENGVLTFDGQPTWTMWDNPDEYKDAIEYLQFLRNVTEGNAIAVNLFENLYEINAQEVTRFFELLENAELNDEAAWAQLEKYYTPEPLWMTHLNESIEAKERYEAMGDIPVEVNDELSNKVTIFVATLDGINPVVYKTLTTVMRYRALFKHFRMNNPRAYDAFLASLNAVSVHPKVTTPTVQRQGRLH